MRILFRDIETRSTVDLKTVGAHRYAADPTTGVWCVGYAVDDGPVEIWIPGQPIPEPFVEAARDSTWLVVAHNDQFERAIEQHVLAPRHGWPQVPIAQHRCTMAMALAAALPGALERAITALSLPHEKDKTGAALMRRMAKPRPDGTWLDDAAALERLCQYCRRDVEAERALYRALPPLTEDEQKIWQLDAVINARGFHTDGALLDAASRVVTTANVSAQAEFRGITGLESTNQVARFIAWLAEQGCIVTDVQKGTLKAALRRNDLTLELRRAITLRLELAHASAAKVEALRTWRGEDGRVRGTLQYHGAATGRWVGRGPQPQNFKRDAADTDSKIAAVMNGGTGLTSPVEAVGDIARAMICGTAGSRLLVADFSGIESRVLAWIAGQQSKIDAWIKFDLTSDPHDDPYVIIGRSLGHPEETARTFGKIADLAFGYQGGVGAWQNFAPEDDASDEATIKRYRDGWRAQHPKVVQFWYATDRAAISAINNPGLTFSVGRVSYCFNDPFLRIRLPSGRSLSYPFAKIDGVDQYGHPRASFLDNAGGKFVPCRFGNGAYGGLWCENVVSGIARDLLAAALMRLEAAGYPVILHVHDEVVAEAPEGFGSVEEFHHLVTRTPAWAEGLPVAAKVRNGPRFAKASPPKEPDSSRGSDAPWDDVEHVRGLYAGAGGSCAHCQKAPNGQEQQHPYGETSIWIHPTCLDGFLKSRMQEEGVRWSDPPPEPKPESQAESKPEPQADTAPKLEPRSKHGSDGHVHGDSGPMRGRAVARWIYQHPDRPNYLRVDKHVLPNGDRKFYQYHWNGAQWIHGVKSSYAERKIPYKLPELIAALRANPDIEVQIAEGEKDADTLIRMGFVATTNPGGAVSWTDDMTAWLRVLGVRRAAAHEDNDEKGRLRTTKLTAELSSFIALRVVRYPDVPVGEDVTWWVEELKHNKEDLAARIEAAPQAAQPLPFINMSRWDQEQAPPREWIVHERIPRGHATLFSGEGSAGKSTIQLQLSIAIVLGREWLATIPSPGPAIFFDAEDDPDEMHRRGDAILAHYGATWNDAIKGGLHLMSFAGQDAVLAAVNRAGRIEPTPIYKQLLEAAGDIKPRMIGIASAANVFAGNENDRSQVQQFIGLLTRVGMLSRGGVQLISHPSLTGINTDSGLSGNTQWHNAVRARFWLKGVKAIDGEQPDSDLREIVFKKNNYGPITDSIVLRWQDGLFLPVPGVASLDQAAREETTKEVFLTLLKRFGAQNRNVSDKPSVSYAPALFAREEEARSAGLSSKNLEAAMRQLFKDGRIWNEPYGKPSRPSYRITPK